MGGGAPWYAGGGVIGGGVIAGCAAADGADAAADALAGVPHCSQNAPFT
jgi:hypothetical protein